MLRVDLRGSWREMGRQYGEAMAEVTSRCIQTFAPWLLQDLPTHLPAIADLRGVLQAHCPDLLEETLGYGEGAGLSEDMAVGYRFFNEVRSRLNPGCSAVFVAEAKEGPLLGRNCDLTEGFESEVQVCIARRPSNGPAAIITTYVGLAGGVGFNEFGLGMAGASAATPASFGTTGLPYSALGYMVLQGCHSVAETRELLARHSFLGKPAILIAGDAGGDSVVLEFAPGAPAFQTDRRGGRHWEACTNFFLTGKVPLDAGARILPNAYARYGRLCHFLGEGLMGRSVAGMAGLLTDIAQPGLCCPEDDPHTLHTAYAQVMDLRGRVMHVTSDHPAEAPFEAVAL